MGYMWEIIGLVLVVYGPHVSIMGLVWPVYGLHVKDYGTRMSCV